MPAKPTPKTVKRLQIDVSEMAFERLKGLKEKTDASSYADVTNRALKLYEYFNDAALRGDEIRLVDKAGKETVVNLL